MEGHLTYKIGDEDKQFFFGNYALEQTLTHFDSSVSDLSDLLGKQLLPFLRMFMYHAAAYPIIKKGEVVNFTPFDIHEWIDQAGGSGFKEGRSYRTPEGDSFRGVSGLHKPRTY
jgi:hypothetical protein